MTGAAARLGRREVFHLAALRRLSAVLVRLPLIEVDELEELIVDAWHCQAARALVEAFDRGDS